MDGVSSAASIVAIAAAGLQISAKLVAFASDIKRASTHVNSLATDVSIVSSILHQLGELVEQKPDQGEVGIFSSHGLATTKASADVCKQIFTVIEEKLRSASKQARTGIKVGDRIELSPIEQARWPFLQPSIDSLRKDLQEAKGTLMLMLQVATLGIHMTLSRNSKGTTSNDPEQHNLVSAIKALQSELLDLKLFSGANAQGVNHANARPRFPAVQEPRDPSSRDRGIDLEPPNKGKMREKELISDHTSKRQSPRVSIGNDSNHHIPHLPRSNREWPLAQTLSSKSTRPFRNLILFFKENGGKWLSVLLQNRTINGHLHLFMQVLDRKLNMSPVRPLFREVKICQQEIHTQLRFDQRQNRASLAQILAMCTKEEHDVIDETLTALGSRASLVSIGRTIPNDNVESEQAQVLSVMHLIIRTFPVKESSVSGTEKSGRTYQRRMPLRPKRSTKISIGLFSKLRNLVRGDHIPWGVSGGRHQVHQQSSIRHYNSSLDTDSPSYSTKFDYASSGDHPAYRRVAYRRQEHPLSTVVPPIPQESRSSVRTPTEIMRDRGIREARKKIEDEARQAQIESDQGWVGGEARLSQEKRSTTAGVTLSYGAGDDLNSYGKSDTAVVGPLSQPESSRRPGERLVSKFASRPYISTGIQGVAKDATRIRPDEHDIPVGDAGGNKRFTTLQGRARESQLSQLQSRALLRQDSERTTDPVSYSKRAQSLSRKPEPERLHAIAYSPSDDTFPRHSAGYNGGVSTSDPAFIGPVRLRKHSAGSWSAGAAFRSRPRDTPVVHTRISSQMPQALEGPELQTSNALSTPAIPMSAGKPLQPEPSGPSDKAARNPTQQSQTERFLDFAMSAQNDDAELATADIDTLLAKYTTVFDPKP